MGKVLTLGKSLVSKSSWLCKITKSLKDGTGSRTPIPAALAIFRCIACLVDWPQFILSAVIRDKLLHYLALLALDEFVA